MSDDFLDLLSDPGDLPEGDNPQDRGVEDLLGSLLGGAGGGDLGSLLGGLMGGGAGQQPSGQSQQPGAGDMGDLLGSLLGGGGGQQPSGQSQQSGAGDMGDLLGSLLGGGAGQPSQPAQPPSGGAGDLLGSLLGGGSSGAAGSGGLGALLGGLLGGGGAGTMGFGGGGVSLPFADTLSEKLGISKQMANMIIMGAIGLLTSSAAKNRSRGSSPNVRVSDLSDPDFIRMSGVSSRLSNEMGVSEDEAIRGLQEAFDLMAAGSEPAGKAKKTKSPKKSTSKSTKKKKSTKKAADSGRELD